MLLSNHMVHKLHSIHSVCSLRTADDTIGCLVCEAVSSFLEENNHLVQGKITSQTSGLISSWDLNFTIFVLGCRFLDKYQTLPWCFYCNGNCCTQKLQLGQKNWHKPIAFLGRGKDTWVQCKSSHADSKVSPNESSCLVSVLRIAAYILPSCSFNGFVKDPYGF